MLRNVSVKKEVMISFLDELDTDGNGRIDLAEAGAGLKFLWKKARGKLKESKKIRTLDE